MKILVCGVESVKDALFVDALELVKQGDAEVSSVLLDFGNVERSSKFSLKARNARAKLVSSIKNLHLADYDHVHFLSPYLADQVLAVDQVKRYSVSSIAEPLADVQETDQIAQRVTNLRSAEFVVCSTETAAAKLKQLTGIREDRVMVRMWPVAPANGTTDPESAPISVVTNQFDEVESVVPFDDLMVDLSGDDVRIISTVKAPIETDVVEWYTLSPKSMRLASVISESRALVMAISDIDIAVPLILLAMSAGVPVVTSEDSGLRGLVRHGQTGIISPERDRMINQASQIAFDQARFNRLRANSTEFYSSKAEGETMISDVVRRITASISAGAQRRTSINLVDGIDIGSISSQVIETH